MTNSNAAQKSADAFRTISEVAESLKLPQHVLRFWETRFTQIKPLKRGGGRRFYRPEDVELLVAIRQLLYGDGYTIRGVQRILKEQGPRAVAALAQGRARQTGAPTSLAPLVAEPPSPLADVAADPVQPVRHEPAFDAGPIGERAQSTVEFRTTEPEPTGEAVPAARATAPDRAPGIAADGLCSLRAVLADIEECKRILIAARG